MKLDPTKVDSALRCLLADIDYDLHKAWESDEEDGKDYYHILVDSFITWYEDES